jgi:hypothetical protein
MATYEVNVPDPQPDTADLIAALEARIAVLENAPPPSGGGGTVGNTVNGKLTVNGELEVIATNGLASKAITIVIPKADIGKPNYPHLRWEYEDSSGKRHFMFSIVSHRTGTNHENHSSVYVATETDNERLSVIDLDTFRPTSSRRLRFENLLVQFGTGDKEAVLEAAKQKISGTVRTIVRDAAGFLKGN